MGFHSHTAGVTNTAPFPPGQNLHGKPSGENQWPAKPATQQGNQAVLWVLTNLMLIGAGLEAFGDLYTHINYSALIIQPSKAVQLSKSGTDGEQEEVFILGEPNPAGKGCK